MGPEQVVIYEWLPSSLKTPRNRGSCTTLGLGRGRKTRGGGNAVRVKGGDEIPYGGGLTHMDGIFTYIWLIFKVHV